MTPRQLIQRARSAIGQGTQYKLGKGGMKPADPNPSDAPGFCDCSGFVCWALGISRRTDHPLYVNFNGGWINTNAMVHDAGNRTGLFRPAPLMIPGVVLVYPGVGRKVGHCGVLTEVGTSPAEAKVVHCSAGNSRRGDAIQETDLSVFRHPGTIAVWYVGLDEGGPLSGSKYG